jgi:peptide-methionine (S)-S-oxide reductase
MSKFLARFALPSLVIVILAGCLVRSDVAASEKVMALPKPAVDETLASAPGQETAVFAGGCFWGVQAVFQHVKGVISATSGYSGGGASTAEYEIVSTGTTNHAESVKVVFDPSQVTYGQLLQVFFSVAHDPTELNHQGPDEGTQYRSVVFYSSDQQKRIADAYVAQLEQAKLFPHKIVTQIVQLKAFYPAEKYHQNYATLHPDNPYIAHYDLPKLTALQQMFPQLYRTSLSGTTVASGGNN